MADQTKLQRLKRLLDSGQLSPDVADRARSTLAREGVIPGRGAAIKEGAIDTATLGFGDELAGKIKGGLAQLILGGKGYNAKGADDLFTQRSRSADDQAQQYNPKSFLGGQVLGGLASAAIPAGGLARAGAQAGRASRMAAGAGAGAAYEGTYSAGAADTNAMGRAAAVPMGAAMGAAFGAAGPLAGDAIAKLWSRARDVPGKIKFGMSPSLPSNDMVRAAQDVGSAAGALPAQEATDLLQKLGPDSVLADVPGFQQQATELVAASGPHSGGGAVAQLLKRRQEGLGANLGEQFDKLSSPEGAVPTPTLGTVARTPQTPAAPVPSDAPTMAQLQLRGQNQQFQPDIGEINIESLRQPHNAALFARKDDELMSETYDRMLQAARDRGDSAMAGEIASAKATALEEETLFRRDLLKQARDAGNVSDSAILEQSNRARDAAKVQQQAGNFEQANTLREESDRLLSEAYGIDRSALVKHQSQQVENTIQGLTEEIDRTNPPEIRDLKEGEHLSDFYNRKAKEMGESGNTRAADRYSQLGQRQKEMENSLRIKWTEDNQGDLFKNPLYTETDASQHGALLRDKEDITEKLNHALRQGDQDSVDVFHAEINQIDDAIRSGDFKTKAGTDFSPGKFANQDDRDTYRKLSELGLSEDSLPAEQWMMQGNPYAMALEERGARTATRAQDNRLTHLNPNSLLVQNLQPHETPVEMFSRMEREQTQRLADFGLSDTKPPDVESPMAKALEEGRKLGLIRDTKLAADKVPTLFKGFGGADLDEVSSRMAENLALPGKRNALKSVIDEALGTAEAMQPGVTKYGGSYIQNPAEGLKKAKAVESKIRWDHALQQFRGGLSTGTLTSKQREAYGEIKSLMSRADSGNLSPEQRFSLLRDARLVASNTFPMSLDELSEKWVGDVKRFQGVQQRVKEGFNPREAMEEYVRGNTRETLDKLKARVAENKMSSDTLQRQTEQWSPELQQQMDESLAQSPEFFRAPQAAPSKPPAPNLAGLTRSDQINDALEHHRSNVLQDAVGFTLGGQKVDASGVAQALNDIVKEASPVAQYTGNLRNSLLAATESSSLPTNALGSVRDRLHRWMQSNMAGSSIQWSQPVPGSSNSRAMALRDAINTAAGSGVGGKSDPSSVLSWLNNNIRNADASSRSPSLASELDLYKGIRDDLTSAVQVGPTQGVALHNLAEGFADAAKRAREQDDTVAVRKLKELQKKATGVLADQVPGYKPIADSFNELRGVEDSLDVGRKLFGNSAATDRNFTDFARKFDSLSEQQREAVKAGAREQLDSMRDFSPQGIGRIGDIFKREGNQRIIKLIAPDIADDFIQSALNTKSMSETYRRVAGQGGNRASRQVAQGSLARLGITPSKQERFGPMNIFKSRGQEATDLINRRYDRGAKANQELGELLTLQGSKRDKVIPALLREAEKRNRPINHFGFDVGGTLGAMMAARYANTR